MGLSHFLATAAEDYERASGTRKSEKAGEREVNAEPASR
jgi:hypothetical protein